jgi:hypothetical protein
MQEPLLLLLTELGSNPSSSVRGAAVRLLQTLARPLPREFIDNGLSDGRCADGGG